MTRVILVTLVVLGLFVSLPARADRRAFSLDLTPGWSVSSMPTPGSTTPRSTISTGPAIWAGARYALSNMFEISAAAYFETPVTIGHNGIVLHTDSGDFAGTLVHQSMRFGAQAGAHAVFGMVWRLHLGFEAGWSQRLYTSLQMIDDQDPGNATDYGLTLSNTSRGNFVLSPLVGIEWVAGDHWSVALMPRAQFLLGGDFAWAVILPLQFSYSWYL